MCTEIESHNFVPNWCVNKCHLFIKANSLFTLSHWLVGVKVLLLSAAPTDFLDVFKLYFYFIGDLRVCMPI